MRTVKNRKTTEEDSIKNTHPHTVLKKLVILQKSKKRDGYGIKPFCYYLTLKEYEKLSH